ncbi:MAG TPA: carbon storage regulator [Isosphaeraceae bacterium]|jgi:carbon storage regulator
MLVLSRKIGQRVKIGDGIVVTVVAARGAHVRVGVEAPHDVTILREELAWPDAEAEPAAPPRTHAVSRA